MKGLEKDLKNIIPPDSVKTDPEDRLAYEADTTFYYAKGKPDAIILPETTEAVSKVIRYAAEKEIPVTPRGAGSGLSGAATPIQGGIVMDMKRMNRIIDINQGNLTAEAEAGVVLSRFHRAVEKQKLFYPPDPQSMSVCTLGGNVATRAGGPHGVKYGTTANYILGLEVVLPDGSIVQTGSSCVKHSVGYDITHLLTGSEGTLGTITKVTTRLLPLPPSNRTLIVTCREVEQATAIVSAIIAAGIVPAMLEYISQAAAALMNSYITPPLSTDGAAFLFVKLDGLEVAIDQEAETIEALCRDMQAVDVRNIMDRKEAKSYWTARAALYPLVVSFFKRVITEDITVPRDRFSDFINALSEISEKVGMPIGVSGHAGDGNVHPTVLISDLGEDELKKSQKAVEEIMRCGLAHGGSISGEHGIGLHKAEFITSELGQRQVELFKTIKRAIDPLEIMNPGKIWIEGGK